MSLTVSSISARIPPIDPAWTRIAAAVLAIGMLAWSGLHSARRGAARRAEIARAESVLAEFSALKRRYEPAVAAESIAWRRTWMALQDLGVVGDERLGLARTVTRAAESAGLENVRVLIGPSDTTGLEGRLSTEGIERKPAAFSLVVEGRGGMRPVIAFLGQLPPSVAATQVTLTRQEGRSRSRIALAVYELDYPNGSPLAALWSSLERGPAGSGGAGRPGG